MEKAGSGVFGYELQGLEHSDPGFFGREVWKLVLDLSEGLGVGLGLAVELVMVSILTRPVLPNAAGKVLELVGIWSIELALGIDASEGGTAPTVLLVVPEMAESCLMVGLGLVVDGWNPYEGNKVSIKVFVKGLEGPRSIGYQRKVKDWGHVGILGFLGRVEPRAWVDHVITAIGCLEASPAKQVGVGVIAMKELWVHRHQEVLGKPLFAVLALQLLGGVGVGHIVEIEHVLGKVCAGCRTQMVGGVLVKVTL